MNLLHILFAFFAAATSSAESGFEGYMITSSGPLFVISSPQGKKSGWIPLGQRFDGASIIDFDARLECIVVERGGHRKVLHLRQTGVRKSSSGDRKARLNALQGLELAYEFAKDGDTLIIALLKRYQALAIAAQRDKAHEAIHKEGQMYIIQQIDNVTKEKRARILNEK